MMAVAELELELEPSEVLRRRMEHEAVAARIEPGGELADAPVAVGAPVGDEVGFLEELDANALCRRAFAGVEDVRRKRDRHAETLRLEPASQPRECLDALGPLEVAQGQKARRRRLRTGVDEV